MFQLVETAKILAHQRAQVFLQTFIDALVTVLSRRTPHGQETAYEVFLGVEWNGEIPRITED